jgi:hypothetical protein
VTAVAQAIFPADDEEIVMAQHQPIEASPEEARFLRRFVRRTTLPWFACIGALAALALGVALSPAPAAAPTAAATPPSGGHDSADHEALRAELATLREGLASLRAAEPGRSTRSEDLEPRLARLEAELSSRPAASAPASASAEDLVTIRDRVYALESRLYDLEKTLQAEARREDPRSSASIPAAPAP